jgi:UDP-GlcNAc:undecaprenyl-phosphate GlcNAc-1-phosphate transferase
MDNATLAGFVALGVATVLTPLAMHIAVRTGAVDRPGDLKPQAAPVAYLGGTAVFVATSPWVLAHKPALFGPLAAALALGVADDYLDLRPRFRLVGQLAVAATVGVLLPVHIIQPLGGILVTATAVLLMNGVNMIDGLDGLAAGVLAVTFVASALLLQGSARALAAAGAGALAGFLLYNRPPARVYLGDGGAYLLGCVAAVLLCAAWAPGQRGSAGVAAAALMAVPAAEVAFAALRRLRAGHSMVTGDRRHPYDLLVAHGVSRERSALTYIAVEALVAAAAVLSGRLHSMPLAAAVALGAAAGLLVLAGACGALGPGREVPT